MISIVFPGQGSQKVGMGTDLYSKFQYVKNLYKKADEILGYKISDVILNGPQEKLNQTTYTQPAIYLIGYVICEVLKKETSFFDKKIHYLAGHSLGEYTALTCSNSLTFEQGLILLKYRGEAMQSAVPLGEGGMLAVLGVETDEIKKIIKENSDKMKCYLANDNSKGQLILSGKNTELDKLIEVLKSNKIKNIKLPVSAPFHCKLMKKATEIMKIEIEKLNFIDSKIKLISNVTADEILDKNELKSLLIQQIESRVRWRESVVNMINKGVTHFIEIGPGKVLSGLVKRINKDVKINSINTEIDIKELNL